MKLAPVLSWFFIIVSLVGFVDATYLTIVRFFDAPLACFIVTGCDIVATSPYAVLLGIPVALLGALYYLLIFLCSVAYLDCRRAFFFHSARVCICIGMAFSLWLLYVQLVLLKALCIYCLISLATSTVLFCGALASFMGRRGTGGAKNS